MIDETSGIKELRRAMRRQRQLHSINQTVNAALVAVLFLSLYAIGRGLTLLVKWLEHL